MEKIERVEPLKKSFIPENIDGAEKKQEAASARAKIYERIEDINKMIKDRPSPEYRKIFEEYNIFTIQEKVAQIEEMIEDNDTTLHPVEDNHFYHTLGNFYAVLGIIDREKTKRTNQELQAASQKHIIGVDLYLDKILQDKEYFRESLETQHGYERNLH